MGTDRYRAAGVDLAAVQRLKGSLLGQIQSTHGKQVIGKLGSFAGLYRLGSYRDPVLVSSTDGVGTKSKIASSFGRYGSLGEDLVNHCINDVFTSGARPLFFLDYIAMDKLSVPVVEELIQGMASACSSAGCALIGGETAEMPGVYARADVELVGFMVGVAESNELLDNSSIESGDVLIGVPSSGLHTNGYSLAREIFKIDEDPGVLNRKDKALGATLGDILLTPHRAYYPLLDSVLPLLKGMAHITGGGLPGNLPRVLPAGLGAQIWLQSWDTPPIFRLLQERGGVSDEEMFRVFNMGVGMMLVASPSHQKQIIDSIAEAWVCGRVVSQESHEAVVFS